MDSQHVEDIARSLAGDSSRRGLLAALTASLLTCLPLALNADAKKKKRRKNTKKSHPKIRTDASCPGPGSGGSGNMGGRFAQTFTAKRSGDLVRQRAVPPLRNMLRPGIHQPVPDRNIPGARPAERFRLYDLRPLVSWRPPAALCDEDGDDQVNRGRGDEFRTLGAEGLAAADVACAGVQAQLLGVAQTADGGGVLRAGLQVRSDEVAGQRRFAVRHGAVRNRRRGQGSAQRAAAHHRPRGEVARRSHLPSRGSCRCKTGCAASCRRGSPRRPGRPGPAIAR